jgi:uncharacterized membrane protein YagU involved in acid resistance
MIGTRVKLFRTVLMLLISATLLTSCASSLFHVGSDANLPPVLAEDELIRPYSKLGRIQIAVEIYGPELKNLQEWGYRALREEAAKMGADAVMLPEVTSRPTSYLIVPSNEYRATGVAIKFK